MCVSRQVRFVFGPPVPRPAPGGPAATRTAGRAHSQRRPGGGGSGERASRHSPTADTHIHGNTARHHAPPPPKCTPMYTIIMVPTPTVPWTRAGLHATHTTADTHVRRPHVLNLAIQDLWDASDQKKIKFLVHQQGATCAEIGKCDDTPMSYVAALHFVRNSITYTIITVPTPTVAWTRAWLIQMGGGGGAQPFAGGTSHATSSTCAHDTPISSGPRRNADATAWDRGVNPDAPAAEPSYHVWTGASANPVPGLKRKWCVGSYCLKAKVRQNGGGPQPPRCRVPPHVMCFGEH